MIIEPVRNFAVAFWVRELFGPLEKWSPGLTILLFVVLPCSHVTQQTSWLHPVSQVQHLPPIAENEDGVRESQT